MSVYTLAIEGQDVHAKRYVPDRRRTFPEPFRRKAEVLLSKALEEASPIRLGNENYVVTRYTVTCDDTIVVDSFSRRPFIGPVPAEIVRASGC